MGGGHRRRWPPQRLPRTTLAARRAGVWPSEPLAAATGPRRGRARVLPRTARVVRFEGGVADEDPQLACEVVGDDQAGARIWMGSEEALELLTAMTHDGAVGCRRPTPLTQRARRVQTCTRSVTRTTERGRGPPADPASVGVPCHERCSRPWTPRRKPQRCGRSLNRHDLRSRLWRTLEHARGATPGLRDV